MANGTPLARTRKLLLKEILRYRLFDVFLLSLCTFVFFIPGIIYLVFANGFMLSQNNIYLVITGYLLLIPFWMIAGLGISGGLYFAKRICWGEGANVLKDFFVGVKEHYKNFLIIYFILGLLYALVKIGVFFAYNVEETQSMAFVVGGIGYAGLFIILIITLFMQTQTIIYTSTIKQLFSNGLKFCIGKIFTNLLLVGFVLFPFIIIEFSTIDVLTWLGYVILAVFHLGISILIFTLYSHSIFDQTINRQYYPQIIRKGLAKDE